MGELRNLIIIGSGPAGYTAALYAARQVILALSPKGRRLLEEYQRAGDEWLTVRVAGLSSGDRATLARAAQILARLAKD